MDFQDKQILVVGAGISGIAVAEILAGKGASVTLNDNKQEQDLLHDVTPARNAGVRIALGYQDNTLLDNIDLMVISPGVPPAIPLVREAEARQILVISEIEVAYQLCQAPIVAVTGTNGKTTTTTLLGELMKTANDDVVVGGNIGMALSKETEAVSEGGVVVAEISSFQLERVRDFCPKVAAILNVTPDHIDRHGSVDNYRLTKERIFAQQTKDDYVVLNYDEPVVRDMAERAPSTVFYFSRQAELTNGMFVKDGAIVLNWNGETTAVCPLADLQIKGNHNVENALAACSVAFLAGVKAEAMHAVLANFGGVEHRIEPVRELNGVGYYNDSKATNPESSIKALEAFSDGIVLIAGGHDKMTDLTEFMTKIKERVTHLILIGEAAGRFRAEAEKMGIESIIDAGFSMEEAVKIAHAKAKEGEAVVLSPACSSYDMFNNFEERGREFKRIVHAL
ncbi:MAG: UDP-N-acetylmuramoyl-L-alanine--D-glutamate ligase [Selenomonadales bacterium]|nr:UDP-N-acetylmuramoyl-L-alanine--D-glutamate ligase [Selenomonadales bacterium]